MPGFVWFRNFTIACIGSGYVPDPIYSDRWFATFAEPVAHERIEADVEALEALFPRSHFPRLLEIGCGLGRHASALVARGHSVVALETNQAMVEAASDQVSAPDVRHMDMREIGSLPGGFDGCYLLWHSFGYFDDESNDAVIAAVAGVVRPGGRLVVDLYNPAWVKRAEGVKSLNGTTTRQRVVGDRQLVEITYDDGQQDSFDWRLYTPDEFAALATRCGFSEIGRGAWWNFSREPTEKDARFQAAFARR